MFILYKLYKYFMESAFYNFILWKFINRIEGGELYSKTIRRIYKDYWKVDVGMYTHGGCFIPRVIDKYTVIGRYCSIANTARVMNRNHPLEYKSTSAIFFNPICSVVSKDAIEYIPLRIGNDVWLGHNSIIMPNVKAIGDGAVIGAGAVVNKNVPPYAIVVGNPARIVRYRFDKEVIEELLKSKWWEKSIEELKHNLGEFQQFIGNPNLPQKEGPE